MSNKRHKAKSGAKVGEWVTCTAKDCQNGGIHATTSELHFAKNKFEEETGVKPSSLHAIPMAFLEKLSTSGELAQHTAAIISQDRAKQIDLGSNDSYSSYRKRHTASFIAEMGPHSYNARRQRTNYINALVSQATEPPTTANTFVLNSEATHALAQFDMEKKDRSGKENIVRIAGHAYNAKLKKSLGTPVSEEEQVSYDYVNDLSNLQKEYREESNSLALREGMERTTDHPFESEKKLFNATQLAPIVKSVPEIISRKKIFLSKFARVTGAKKAN